MQSQTAVVLGATGLIGNLLVQQLLNDAAFSKVRVLVRKSFPLEHPKLETVFVNFADHNDFSEKTGKADCLFCCIGTTQKKVKGDKTASLPGMPAQNICGAPDSSCFGTASIWDRADDTRFLVSFIDSRLSVHTNTFKWQGQCTECGVWNTLSEIVLEPAKASTGGARHGGYAGTL